MMAGAGMTPPPLAGADQLGLDDVLARLERAAEEWGEDFEPPTILRRLVAQGRLGVKSGQGFFPYPRPDPGWIDRPGQARDAAVEVAIAWLDRPPANSLSPEVIETLAPALGGGPGRQSGPSADLRLGQPDAVLRRRRHQGVPGDGRAGRPRRCSTPRTRLFRSLETLRIVTIAAVNAPLWAAAASWRWPATSGSRPSRPASASRRSTSGSSPASAAPSGCRGWSGRPRRWSST